MKIDVDGQAGFVELVDWMASDPADKTVKAARVSYAGDDRPKDPAKDIRLLRRLAADGHWSPFRHSPVTLHVSAPEFVARQWWKHVVGGPYTFVDTGWNEVSQRYTSVSDVYMPAAYHWQAKDTKQGSAGIHEGSAGWIARYTAAVGHAIDLYDDMIARGISREEARMHLPLSMYTRWYWTPSQQALMHFVNLRRHHAAQSHIRAYADAVQSICRAHYGEAWAAFEEHEDGYSM